MIFFVWGLIVVVGNSNGYTTHNNQPRKGERGEATKQGKSINK